MIYKISPNPSRRVESTTLPSGPEALYGPEAKEGEKKGRYDPLDYAKSHFNN